MDCFVSWLNSVREKQGHEHLAIDGKTLRRSHHNGDKMTALHLLSVMAVDSGLVVYQSCSAGKKNEIKSVQGRALNCLMLKTVVSPWMRCTARKRRCPH